MNDSRLPISLLLMRISVFVVMVMWTVDKFARPEHAAAVYENFYFIGGLGSVVFYVIAAIESLILVMFVIGYKKRLSYGAVLLLHGISTISSFKQYLMPFTGPNLLFFAAWPMLAACFTLYYLRDQDTIWTLE